MRSMESQKKRRDVIVVLCILLRVGLHPSLYQWQCKTRVYIDWEDKVASVESANIRVIRETVHGENLDLYGYSVGASGVVFAKQNDRYYALTAYHVVHSAEADCEGEPYEERYLVATVFSPSRQGYSLWSLQDYYQNLAEAAIEYTDEALDLAIISFQSPDELYAVSVAASPIEKDTKIVSIGNPDNAAHESFVKSYGKVLSSKKELFKTDDGQMSSNVMRHNAYVTYGNSGGAVLNEEMQLVGINIGGRTDFFGRFRCGMFIDNEQIQQCLEAWHGGR